MSETTPIQTKYSSRPNRYPEIFAKVVELARGGEDVGKRVLSFGCSGGFECATLHDLYFTHPDDRIVGVDVNAQAIRWAGFNQRRPRVSYYHSENPAYASQPPFDAIFAMSVLCVHLDTVRNDGDMDSFPFSRFAEVCAILDQRLNPGGVLAIYNANYRFGDTPTAANYTPIEDPSEKPAYVPTFAPDGSPVTERYPYTIFVKRPA